MNKKELKQKIAETFVNNQIANKSQYIRDLIEKEVSEDNTVVNKSDLYIIKNNITEINKRQIEGYSTFKKVEENLITLDKNIFKVWSLLFVVFILSVINLLIN